MGLLRIFCVALALVGALGLPDIANAQPTFGTTALHPDRYAPGVTVCTDCLDINVSSITDPDGVDPNSVIATPAQAGLPAVKLFRIGSGVFTGVWQYIGPLPPGIQPGTVYTISATNSLGQTSIAQTPAFIPLPPDFVIPPAVLIGERDGELTVTWDRQVLSIGEVLWYQVRVQRNNVAVFNSGSFQPPTITRTRHAYTIPSGVVSSGESIVLDIVASLRERGPDGGTSGRARTFTPPITIVQDGSSPAVPILPSKIPQDGTFEFIDVGSGQWFDPPAASGFEYTMTSPGSLFTRVLDFPAGFGSKFTVSTGADVLGAFGPGEQLTFSDGGVKEFTVSGINPLVDANNPNAFPLRLEFNSPVARFEMRATPHPAPATTTLVASVLPSSRSVTVTGAATAFATIVAAGTAGATGCRIAPVSAIPATFTYQTTDPATNQVTGTPNTPAAIAAGGSQTFVMAISPTGPFDATEVQLSFSCSDMNPVESIPGVNTMLLSASTNNVPDIIAIAATPSGNGILDIPGPDGTAAFAVAAANVGVGGQITVSGDTGGADVPVSITICETDPATAACKSVIGPSVTTQVDAGRTPTFSLFVQGAGIVPFDPATSRVFVRFREGLATRGATSVAVRTQ